MVAARACSRATIITNMAHFAGVAIAANVINQNARQRWNDIYRTGVLHEMSLQLSSFYVKQQSHALS
jgi:hexokinase